MFSDSLIIAFVSKASPWRSEQAQVLFQVDNYANYLYFHGMAVQMAEALAEWSHACIRKELGYGDLPDNIRDMLAQRDRDQPTIANISLIELSHN